MEAKSMLKVLATHPTVVALFSMCVFLGVSQGQEKAVDGALAHFRFNSDARNAKAGKPDFQLRNVEFDDNSLYLSGRYEFTAGAGGYRAVCETPDQTYEGFSVALRFKAEEFATRKRNLITGGTAYRWFGLERSDAGNLTVTLNNAAFEKEIDGAKLEAGKWIVVSCSVDAAKRRVVAALNGKKVADIDLPKDFEFDVAKLDAKDRDKQWSFTNYSNGKTFHGRVDELIIYDRALSAAELEKIDLHP